MAANQFSWASQRQRPYGSYQMSARPSKGHLLARSLFQFRLIRRKSRHTKMLFLLRVYVLLTRLLGLSNLYYSAQRERFELYHKPTVIWCLCVNLVLVVLLPLCFTFLVRHFFSCGSIGLNRLLALWVASLGLLIYLITIWDVWYKRKRIMQLATDYLRLYRIYQQQIDELSFKHPSRSITNSVMHFKCVQLCARLVAICVWLYGIGSVSRCKPKTTAPPHQRIFIGFYYVHMELFMLLLDGNVFAGLAVGNLLLDMLLQQLESIEREVRFLLQLQRMGKLDSFRAAWYRQLVKAVAVLLKQQSHLKRFIGDLIAAYRLQLLGIFVYQFFINIVAVFNFILLLSQASCNPYAFVLIVFGFVINFGSLMLLLHLCRRIRQGYVHMRKLIYLIWCLIDKNQSAELEQQLELFALALLQQPHRMHVCGLFNLNLSTAMALSRGILLYLLLLIQIAIMEFQYEF